MNWLSVLILAIPVLCFFYGIQRGMVRTAFSVFSLIVTLILGSIITPFVSDFLKNEVPVYDLLQEKCEESISETLEATLNEQMDRETQNLFISELSLPEELKQVLIRNNNVEGYNRLLAQSFGEYLSHSIAQMTIGVISLILTFIVISILMNILCGILDGIFSLPILSFINRAGGAVLGVLQGIFVIWIIFLVITLFWDTSWAKEATIMIQENSITEYLYQNNMLLRFLSGIIK